MRLLINAGITKIIYIEDYNDNLTNELAKECGIKIIKYKGEENMKKIKINEQAVNNALNNAKKNFNKVCDKLSNVFNKTEKPVEEPHQCKCTHCKCKEEAQKSVEPEFDVPFMFDIDLEQLQDADGDKLE